MGLILPRRRASGLNVADVFSTDLIDGNNSTQSVTNPLDMSGEGGAVWIKNRTDATGHFLFDTERGALKALFPQGANAEATPSPNTLTTFNTDGYSLGPNTNVNGIGDDYVGWSFRKAPSFFDVVTFSANVSGGATFSHSLGSAPGMVLLKRTDTAGSWLTYHVETGENAYLELQATAAQSTATGWISTTDSSVTVGSGWLGASASCVAYLFAHDVSDNGIIQCGSYTGNGSSNGPTITLGWEPQWVMIKRTDSTGDWMMFDNVRGTFNPRTNYLFANSSTVEATVGNGIDFISTGFQPKNFGPLTNASNGNYIYTAIPKEAA